MRLAKLQFSWPRPPHHTSQVYSAPHTVGLQLCRDRALYWTSCVGLVLEGICQLAALCGIACLIIHHKSAKLPAEVGRVLRCTRGPSALFSCEMVLQCLQRNIHLKASSRCSFLVVAVHCAAELRALLGSRCGSTLILIVRCLVCLQVRPFTLMGEDWRSTTHAN